jgi:hypothetical protein
LLPLLLLSRARDPDGEDKDNDDDDAELSEVSSAERSKDGNGGHVKETEGETNYRTQRKRSRGSAQEESTLRSTRKEERGHTDATHVSHSTDPSVRLGELLGRSNVKKHVSKRGLLQKAIEKESGRLSRSAKN